MYYERLVFSTIIIILFILLANTYFVDKSVTHVYSDIDMEHYLVRDEDDKMTAANVLAKIKQNMFNLKDFVYNNKTTGKISMNSQMYVFSEYEQYIDQLNERLNGVEIIESSKDSLYTSYTVNKGEKMVFCIRTKRLIQNKNPIHDFNLLMYVVIHEMSHVACPENGHTELFKKIFSFMCACAIHIGIYTKIDFNNNPEEYCGMYITDSII